MVGSKALAIVSCVAYLSVELWGTSGRAVMFVIFELLIGISVGTLPAPAPLKKTFTI